MSGTVERKPLASHHTGACDFRRWCQTHDVRLENNSREAMDAHGRKAARATSISIGEVEPCKFEMRCETGVSR